MSLLLLVGAAWAGAACLPAPAAAEVATWRGHAYRRVGACGTVPVWRTARTDSTFRDRAEAAGPVILWADESVDPTAEADWPAPPGNLYLSVVVPLDEDGARAHVEAALEAFRARHAPGVAWTAGWDGPYGAHRAADGRFVTGLALQAAPGGGTAIGLDLHLHADEAAYAALGAAGRHATLAGLAGSAPSPEAAVWALLERLWMPAAPRPR